MTVIRVVSANIKANPLVAQSKVAARIKQAMALGDVVMGQEITPSRYKSAWTASAKATGKATYGTGSETPISVGGGLRATKAYTTKVHGGLAKVSPTRAYTVVQAVTPDGLKVAFVCLHPVSKGYEGARHRATKWSWRNARLKQYQAAVAKETASLHAAGFTVVVGGDCNDPKPPRPHRDAAVLAGSGLDHMWVLAAGGHSAGSRSQHITPASPSLRMDHPIIVGSFDLTRAGSKPTTPSPVTSEPAPKPTPTKEPAVASTVSRVLKVAAAEVGYHEGRSGSNWNNIQKFSPAVPGLEWSQGQAWCATFVSWVALKADCASLYPRTASTDAAASWWQKQGRWSEYPAVGAQGFLAHGTDEYHTFIVERFDDTFIYTIEGNTNNNGSSQGDGVYRLRRRRRDANVEGYGVPRFPEGVTSADPKWAHAAPTPSTPAAPDNEEMTVAQYDELKKMIGDIADDVKAIKASQGRNESNYKRLNIVMGDVSDIAAAVAGDTLEAAK